jgi:hypothetical protein
LKFEKIKSSYHSAAVKSFFSESLSCRMWKKTYRKCIHVGNLIWHIMHHFTILIFILLIKWCVYLWSWIFKKSLALAKQILTTCIWSWQFFYFMPWVFSFFLIYFTSCTKMRCKNQLYTRFSIDFTHRKLWNQILKKKNAHKFIFTAYLCTWSKVDEKKSCLTVEKLSQS